MGGMQPTGRGAAEEHHRVVVVGAGMSGIGTTVRLFRRGIRDVVVLEAADRPGGTWRVNTYPGCQCDVPSNLYSLSFAPNPAWTTTFPLQPEIRSYVEDVAARFGVDDVVRYGTELLDASWHGDGARWRLTTSAGPLSADVLVMAVGFLAEPFVPPLPGLDSFAGPVFHSATWDHSVPLEGRRVAVVGTGASAVQLIPEIAVRVAHLDVYQRTPSWVLPHFNRRVPRAERWLYRTLPAVQQARRGLTYLMSETRHSMFTRPGAMNRAARALAWANIRRAIRDRDLADRLTPRYELGCKRVLLSNRYYPALARPNVDVVTEPVVAVTPTGVVSASGVERPADVLVMATGFRVTHRAVYERVHGDRGQDLNEGFAADGAYLGMAAAGFPNLFCLGGPTSGVGYTSFLFMLECQQDYAVEAISAMADRSIATFEVRPEVQARYFRRIQDETDDKVWFSGCTSWFLDERGRNIAVWPGYSWAFRRLTRRFDVENYRVTARGRARTTA